MGVTLFCINLKRFDVPRALGGLCTVSDPAEWIAGVMRECARLGLGKLPGASVVFMVPESLIYSAREALRAFPTAETAGLQLGCQGVFRRDVAPGGNFGAFTSLRPAKAMKAMGCEWALVGHSEERRALLEIMTDYDPAISGNPEKNAHAARIIDGMLHDSVLRAAEAGLNVLFCVGESSEEQGAGPREEQLRNAGAVIRRQVKSALANASGNIAVAYEPIWAIGPGKPTPDGDYIRFALDTARDEAAKALGAPVAAVYGGGLKKENADVVAGAGSDGGLVALTRFSGDIGFYPSELAEIIATYTRQPGAAG